MQFVEINCKFVFFFLKNNIKNIFCRAYASIWNRSTSRTLTVPSQYSFLFPTQNNAISTRTCSWLDKGRSLKTISSLLKTRWIETLSSNLTQGWAGYFWCIHKYEVIKLMIWYSANRCFFSTIYCCCCENGKRTSIWDVSSYKFAWGHSNQINLWMSVSFRHNRVSTENQIIAK